MSSGSSSAAGSSAAAGRPGRVGARQLLRVRAVWVFPLIGGSVVVILLTAFYIGSVVNPVGHLHGLPVAIVNQDRGATAGAQRVDFGQQVQAGLSRSPAVAGRLGLADTTRRAAEQVMDRGGSYATVVIPAGFTASLLFVYAGLACAGGTVPIQALPVFLRWLAESEPLRQILAGTRSILYFGAQADAGLTRSVVAAAAGLVFWLAAGTALVRWYDRKGLSRIDPRLLEYVNRTAQDYKSRNADPPHQGSPAQPDHPGPRGD